MGESKASMETIATIEMGMRREYNASSDKRKA